MRWQLTEKRTLLETIPFDVEELHLRDGDTSAAHPYYRLSCPDWVNVLPITHDGHAILIRQDRIGSQSRVLETPGGVVNWQEVNDPTLTAARELEEETGYISQRLLPLLVVNPNPALQNNRIHLFLALGCSLNPTRRHFPDPEEKIDVALTPVHQLEELVRTGRVDHALSALCIMLAGKYISISGRPAGAEAP